MISSKQFEGKSAKLKNFMFGVLDSTSADIGQKFGLQKRMKFHSSYFYILCSIMLATRTETSWYWWTIILLLCTTFRYLKNVSLFTKKQTILENIHKIYGKKPLKIIKVVVTRWLTHWGASQWILDCLQRLPETADYICQHTNESDVRDFQYIWL